MIYPPRFEFIILLFQNWKQFSVLLNIFLPRGFDIYFKVGMRIFTDYRNENIRKNIV